MDAMLVPIGAGLAIGITGLGIALGQSMLTTKSVDILGKNPILVGTLRIYTILGVALVESAAIYGLIVAFSILGAETISGLEAIAAGLSIGLTGFGAAYGEGMVVGYALEAVNRNPQNKNTVLQFMILFVALIEAVAIYGFIISFSIIS